MVLRDRQLLRVGDPPGRYLNQWYETFIWAKDDRDEAFKHGLFGVWLVSVPSRSLWRLDRSLVLSTLGARSERSVGPWSEDEPWALRDDISTVLGGTEVDKQACDELAWYVTQNAVVPLEASPVTAKALITVAGAGGQGVLATYLDQPLLILLVPAGLVLLGAARGVADGLEEGLRRRILDLLLTDDDPRVEGKGEGDLPRPS